MIYRLRYCNKDGIEARVDIQKGSSTPVIEVEGTERPFILSYNNDKGNKSGMFLTSSADIEIYETADFNIDNLKTSNETELSVTHYIDNVVTWKGFIIPDFFSIEVRNNPVITMTASDRLGTLKNVTLSDLPTMISLRELAILCLNKTGLTLPLKTMADFSNGTGVNDFFNSKILTQRLSDTKGRSISCYDILSSILTASNSFLVQRSGAWHIINKIQHEAGSGKLYTGATSFINWSDVIFNFSDISIGGRRTIVPVAASTGVYHEHGGGLSYPDNFDFSNDLTGWTAVNGFVASINNKLVEEFEQIGSFQDVQRTVEPVYKETTTNKYLVNLNYGINYAGANKPYLRSPNIPIAYPNTNEVNITVDINATAPFINDLMGITTINAKVNLAIIASDGTNTLFLDGNGVFQTLTKDPYIHSMRFDGDKNMASVTSSKSIKGLLKVESGSLSDYNVTVRIYGHSGSVSGGGTGVVYRVASLINSVQVKISTLSDLPNGNIYKIEQGSNFTKEHETETTVFGDYITSGLNGYFYNYPIDDTSSLYNSSNELTSKWTAYNDTEQLPLLQHVTRQRSRLFSVAHDLLSAEIEVNNFDPLAIFVSCDKRYTVVSAKFDFFKSNLSVELEEVAFQNNVIREYIYSYFGDGESGIKSIGGISGGSGGGTGGGLTPEQLEILSFWKKDPDRENTIFTEMNAYSKLELSAYGADDGGDGGGSDYERLDTWASYDASKAGWVLSAFLGNDLNTRVIAIDDRLTDLENTAGGGTVTSVGISVPTGLSVSNSPITSSGVIAIGLQTGYSIPTTAKQGQWDTAYSNSHTHANKTVLDGITSALVSNWNTAYTNNHTHSNKTVLDGITSALVGNWNTAFTNNHTHSNKAVLDGITSALVSNWNTAFTNNHTHSNKTIIDKLTQGNIDVLSKLSVDANGNLKIDANAYATGELSAYGAGDGGGSGGGIIETVYGYGNLGQTFNNSILTDTFNAYTINQINTRLVSVESGSATTVNTTGTGNAITSISKSGTVVTATKGATFSLDNHLHTGVYEPAFSKNTAFNKNFGTTAGTVAQGNDSRIINGQTAYGWGNHASENYFKNDYLVSRNVQSYDANNGGNSGYVASYYSNNWLTNGAFSAYGGLITWARTGVGLKLQIQYDVGHANPTGGRLAFRTSNSNTDNDSYTNWKELYHTGNLTSLSQLTDNIGVATHIANTSNPHNVTKAQVGLGNVDNTSDLNKPISTAVQNALNLKLDKSVFDDLFEKVEVSTGVFAIKAKYSFYSIGEVSAYGIGSGGGGTSYDRLDAWADYDSTKSGWVLSALLGNELNTRVGNLEGGSALTVNTTGTGNAITSISKSGTVITASKDLTFSLSNHLHTGVYEPVFSKNTAFNKNFGTTAGTVAEGNDSRIINGQTAFGWGNHATAGYALNSAFNTHNNDNVRHITGAERTKWDGVVTDFDNLEIGGRNLIPKSNFVGLGNSNGWNVVYDPSYNGGVALKLDNGSKALRNIKTLNNCPIGSYTLSARYYISPEYNTDFRIATAFTQPNQIHNNLFGVKVGEWHTESIVFENTIEGSDITVSLYNSNVFTQGYIIVDWIKLEKGNKATDWTPAPEDQVSDWNTTDVNSFSFIKNKPTLLSQFTDNIGVATHIANTSNPHSVTKAQVGLGNVDNTSDLNKPISTATQAALNGKVSKSGDTMSGELKFNGALNGITTPPIGGQWVQIWALQGNELTDPVTPNTNFFGIATQYIAPTRHIGFFGAGVENAWIGLHNGVAWFRASVTAPTFIGALTGNASSATKLQTARTIAGVSFDGTADIAIPFANLASKPTTLSGYGITDAVTLNTAQTISGAKTFSSALTASISVASPKVIFNAAGWSMEQVGSELQMKHNNVLKMRFTSTGSIIATEEITAFG